MTVSKYNGVASTFNGVARRFDFAPLEADKLNWYPRSALPPEIPAIDLNKVNTEEELAQFLVDIRKSGLFYIVDHGIPEEISIGCYNAFREFCNLPEEAREKYNTDESFKSGGYVPFKGTSIGGGNLFERQKDFVVKFFWRGPSVVNRSPNDRFAEFHDEHHRKTAELAEKIITTILKALKTRFPEFHPDELKDNINVRNMFFSNRIYPEAPPDDGEKADYRLVPHRDLSFITLANQVPANNGFKGLFILTGDGEKIPVPPIRNSYLVFIGQGLSYLTNKYLPAALHGVDFPDNTNFEGSERASLISFYEPNDYMMPSKNINPLPEEIFEKSCTFYDDVGVGRAGTTYNYVRYKFHEGYYL
uniref:Alpha-ketoglutarate dependent kainoid synthase n=1 Tax=Digenea simplex TaxID=945030 RepID=KABC_DIGSM|nr:RecName: Full=Alpha-ketoglutarate dependent kainoid synthase; Short=Alpha-KG dependent kainoid synthase; AltName: Full=Kainic acid biosynthesis cluster protein C; Short=DsKabC [Digenea simplex]QCC62383.1 KabC [Digenea simplex]